MDFPPNTTQIILAFIPIIGTVIAALLQNEKSNSSNKTSTTNKGKIKNVAPILTLGISLSIIVIMFIFITLNKQTESLVSKQTEPSINIQTGTWKSDDIKGDKNITNFNNTLAKDVPNNTESTRPYFETITFKKPFKKPPKVLVSFSTLDCATYDDKKDENGNSIRTYRNLRIRVEAKEIKEDKFEIHVSTWNDSRVSGFEVSWIAFEEEYK